VIELLLVLLTGSLSHRNQVAPVELEDIIASHQMS
jgi:hypothetical protein